ncbi:hypothetical protein B0T14DRAFT_508325, partial [Immersiella caudata]
MKSKGRTIGPLGSASGVLLGMRLGRRPDVCYRTPPRRPAAKVGRQAVPRHVGVRQFSRVDVPDAPRLGRGPVLDGSRPCLEDFSLFFRLAGDV